LELLKEYELTQQMACHYDNMNWNIGQIILGSNVVGVGLAGSDANAYLALALISFVTLVLWRYFFLRHKNIQVHKFRRLHAIEKELEFRQHQDVDDADKCDTTSTPSPKRQEFGWLPKPVGNWAKRKGLVKSDGLTSRGFLFSIVCIVPSAHLLMFLLLRYLGAAKAGVASITG